MTLLEVKEETLASDVVSFVRQFGLEKEFQELTGVSIEDELLFSKIESDSSIIAELLDRLDGLFHFHYDVEEDAFIIWEFEE